MKRQLPVLFFTILTIMLFNLGALSQKGKPSACPSPPPLPDYDTKCSLGTSGCLDTSFGVDGIATFITPAPFTGTTIKAIVVQPWDGKIVAAGSMNTGFVMRLNPDGSLDRTFGDVDPSNPLQRSGFLVDNSSQYYSIALQNDGYIVVGGSRPEWGGWAVRRYEPDGTPDASFGNGGLVAPGFGLYVAGLAVQSDGKIVAAGGGGNFEVMRLNPSDGSPDLTFSGDGKLSVNPSATSFGSGGGNAIALQWIAGEERTVVGGSASDATTKKQQNTAVTKWALMRFRSDGSVDTSFDGDGRVGTDFFGRQGIIFRIAVDDQNRIVAAGQVHPTGCTDSPDAGFARYNENGSLDTSFSADGKTHIDIYGHGNYVHDLALQMVGPEQKIVGFGITTDANRDRVVIRLDADGSPDSSFGPGTFGAGKVTYDLGTDAFFGYGAVQPDNMIVTGSSAGPNAAFIRYLP